MVLERFGKYLLLEKIASGGMAEVYLAKTVGLNNFVAIKRILPQFSQNPEFLVMFKEEAKIAANLRHSNIVSIHYFGQENGQLFLVMDFVEGQNLRQILNLLKKEGKYLSLDQIVYIVREVAAGLDYAHRALDNSTGKPLNIIHRDMSPQNIMISFEGEVKIVDFGIAKAETQIEHTQAGVIKGKFSYMSPEQAEGQPLDGRTDIFSLGVILWELLTKERLFVGSNEAATIKKVRDCQIPSIRKIDPNIPIELERITLKALSKNIDMRYSSAQVFHRDLNLFLNTQFPEFSKTDFSKFMKTLFRDLYIDNRKKLSEYSQISDESSEFEKNEKTKTLTANLPLDDTNPTKNTESIPGFDLVKQDPIDLNSLKVSLTNSNLQPPSSSPTESAPKSNEDNIMNKTQTMSKSVSHTKTVTKFQSNSKVISSSVSGYKTSKVETKKDHSIIIYGLVSSILIGFLAFYYFYKKMVRNKNEKDLVAITMNSTHTSGLESNSNQKVNIKSSPQVTQQNQVKNIVPISIFSNPSGAIVELNGKQVGLTPYRGSLYASQSINLVLKKENFITYKETLKANAGDPIRIEVNLQPEPPKGYLSIELIGATEDVIVEINGEKVQDLGKLELYPVQAGIPVEIKAINPRNNTQGYLKTQVNSHEKRKIKLVIKQDLSF